MFELLQKVNSPDDLKKFSLKELEKYAEEVRGRITQASIKNGGHLAPSLGAVEIAIALHFVLNSPHDKILWDVGHQAYAHKIICGRQNQFDDLRTDEGISGFIKPIESEHDAFISGHSSNALSAATGISRADRLNGTNKKVAVVIGDGALTGGMAFEALNDLGATKEPIMIILNDNDMSISKNVGALSRHFASLRISKSYHRLKNRIRRVVSGIPFVGKGIFKLLDKTRKAISAVVGTHKMFEHMGISYYGPYDGHDLANIIKVFKQSKDLKCPVILHLNTTKGKGFEASEKDPSNYHGISPALENKENSFSKIVGETLCELASENSKIYAITAAMAQGTGLDIFRDKYPKNYSDVAIAEQHAVTLAAGLATDGIKPFVAVYSSFLQRAYDQIMHDVAICNLPVTFLIDRAGVIGSDGVTHQGLFDIAYLSSIPNIAIMAPKDGLEFKAMIEFAGSYKAPLAIRYPKSYKKDFGFTSRIELGKWEEFPFVEGFGKPKTLDSKIEKQIYIIAYGNRMLELAAKTQGARIINARCIKPLDTNLLDSVAINNSTIIVLEDAIESGSLASSITSYLSKEGSIAKGTKVIPLNLGDEFIHSHSIQKAFELNNLTSEYIQNLIDNIK